MCHRYSQTPLIGSPSVWNSSVGMNSPHVLIFPHLVFGCVNMLVLCEVESACPTHTHDCYETGSILSSLTCCGLAVTGRDSFTGHQ